MIHRGQGVPTSRNQALSLLAAIDWDLNRLTDEQRQAIRTLYRLDEPVQLPRGARYIARPEGPRE